MSTDFPLLFFSYSRADAGFVIRLARDLRDAGVNLWIDKLDISPGEHWDHAVEKALQTSSAVLLVLSPSSVGSTNVMDEVSFALDKHKRVVPVLFRSCDVPFRLHRLQYIDFTADYARGLMQLLRALDATGHTSEQAELALNKTKKPPNTELTRTIQKREVLEASSVTPARKEGTFVPKQEPPLETKDTAQKRNSPLETYAQDAVSTREQFISSPLTPMNAGVNIPDSDVNLSKDTLYPRTSRSQKKGTIPHRLPWPTIFIIAALIVFATIVFTRFERDVSLSKIDTQQPTIQLPGESRKASPQNSSPTEAPSQEVKRFAVVQCGSIQDTNIRLEWYIGPDKTMSWDEAKAWSESLKECDGHWEMPTITQLSTLYDRRLTAGIGFSQSGRNFPAHIDPVFNKIGGGSWVWSREAKNAQTARAFNFNQGYAVEYEKNNSTYTTRAFAVRKTSN